MTLGTVQIMVPGRCSRQRVQNRRANPLARLACSVGFVSWKRGSVRSPRNLQSPPGARLPPAIVERSDSLYIAGSAVLGLHRLIRTRFAWLIEDQNRQPAVMPS